VYDLRTRRSKAVSIGRLALTVLAGYGGTRFVSNTQFQIAWPARTRAAPQIGLTSALSGRVVFQDAGSSSADVAIDVERDPTRNEAYTGTYTIPQPIAPSRLGTLTATF